MSTRIAKIGTLALLAFGAMSLAAAPACDQPKPKCNVGRGSFAAKYIYASGPESCKEVKGDVLGLNAYNPPDSSGRPNLDVGSVAIRSLTLGTLAQNADGTSAADPDATHHPYALGNFTTAEPGDDDFCQIPQFAPAVQNLGEIPADEENEVAGQAATQMTYDWKNFKVYVTSTIAGTQFSADLTLTTDGVACGYHVVAMYPYVDCSAPDPADEKKTVPDNAACNAAPDPDNGRPTGSGISPDFPVTCNADLMACFLTSDTIPALR